MAVSKWSAAHTELREILCDLYDEKGKAKRVAKDVGIDWASIDTDGAIRSVWHEVIDECRRQGMLPKLIDLAAQESPMQSDALRQVFASDHPSVSSPTNIRENVQWRDSAPVAQLERIIGTQSTLLPIGFLELGLQRARSVVRVVTASGESGTGFLVSNNLLVTNHHVLPSESVAKQSLVEFNYEKSAEGLDKPIERAELSPVDGFATSQSNDWTVVRVKGDVNKTWGAIPLTNGKAVLEQRVIIIQHPGGGPKQIALSHNLVTYADETIVQYLTDTMPGSSGSPVFSENWELVALHHSGGWLRQPGSKELLYRNEGIAIGQVLLGAAGLLKI